MRSSRNVQVENAFCRCQSSRSYDNLQEMFFLIPQCSQLLIYSFACRSSHFGDHSTATNNFGSASGANFPTPPSMSRLEAVIRVLRSAKKVMHYEALTKQALRMGLIRFSGSQGTAGESMKAFLNKIIRG